MDVALFIKPLVEYGFVGLSGVLLGIVVWLIKRLLALLQETNQIIAANTQAITDLQKSARENQDLVARLHEKLITRPCIARGE